MIEPEVKVDKRTREYKNSQQPVVFEQGCPEAARMALDEARSKPDYEKIENNPGWKLCMYCGKELPPNEDGSPKFRRFPEPCYDCIWRNK